ncbi:hypothetical protein KL930_002018 [Ogataea haglerorum]|uniref:Arf-GAP domain-containing protein n=1 Tax=Ogataea haglerorum TaxID=1937702 RepID=A0ABQ7RL83_9ASCO|nr:hypothetical protein KL914_001147 [Ogataea haglerorum]KAG7710982.1 hypothetical protein KL950_000948 [Ogataea haglerorum]KAG7733747.1 hypothetical protein KL948_000949 [Ogataea haglerorum]KAG7741066.1 hypothetical protein KL923_001707 [Ogataea haglerorum]KAG7748278.1 hypothetical protein KL912_002183 [Ogataea haglerorum]
MGTVAMRRRCARATADALGGRMQFMLASTDVSQVKSLSLDVWTTQELDALASMGNKKNQRLWNSHKEPFPYDEDDKGAITLYLRNKYIKGLFRNTPIDPADYRLSRSDSRRSGRGRDEYGSSRGLRRGSSSRGQYADLSRKLRYDYGFEDEERNLDALERSGGDIKLALRILAKEKEETPPPLPRRRATAGALLDSAKTGATDVDWLSGGGPTQQVQQVQQAQTGAPEVQIYQYIDPNTGQVYYIDSNGQQYMDQNQAQMEAQMQMQMQMQQMQQQQLLQQRQLANAQVLSAYNQPTGQPGQTGMGQGFF